MNYFSRPFLLFLTLNEKNKQSYCKDNKNQKNLKSEKTTHKCLSLCWGWSEITHGFQQLSQWTCGSGFSVLQSECMTPNT